MSSNPYHNNPIITRSNYEEYFLLYVDKELTEEEKTAVDQFLLLNPDLYQELEILLQTKLPPEHISLEGKEGLFSEGMKMKAVDENLLLYVDNELPEEEREGVDADLAKDDAYRLQYELLLQTKSNASEVVACPFKEQLYRHEQRRIPVLWWRVAAAVLLVLSFGTIILTSRQQPETVVVARQPEEKQTIKQAIEPTIQPAEIPSDMAIEKTSIPAENQERATPVLALQKEDKKEVAGMKNNLQEETALAEEIIVVVEKLKKPDNTVVLMPEKVEDPVKEPLTKEPVTSDALYALNHTDTPVKTADDDKNKGSLKGLLRMATRFVERNTSINVTNEDEELMIGAVAISLK